ncbi:MAG: transcriptional regulator [SAR324 cluster bacterium]|nr:transcriptional regulator [SAR324 cluster bacterium]
MRHCVVESAIGDLMAELGRTNRTKFRNQILAPLLDADLVEMTVPDKPRSSKQRYRLTAKGRAFLDPLKP